MVFPLQQWLQKRSSMLRYTHIACRVVPNIVQGKCAQANKGAVIRLATQTIVCQRVKCQDVRMPRSANEFASMSRRDGTKKQSNYIHLCNK